MFQGAESEAGRGGSRAAQSPGAEPGSAEGAAASSRPHRMASNIFGPTEEPQHIPRRTNPPGGKGSGIFEDSTPLQTRQRLNPPGGKTSDIFGAPVAATAPLAHPNKPKDHIFMCEGADPKPGLDAAAGAAPREEQVEEGRPGDTMDRHEPRLGPRPRSHNKVLNPPGGKSSISFY